MPIPTEGLGEKRYRAPLAKKAQDTAAIVEKIAGAAMALRSTPVPADQAVEVDASFAAEFAALEAQEAAAKQPIEIADPYNAAPTHARTTVVDGQKVIDMGSVKITATPEKLTIERPPAPQAAAHEHSTPPLSAKTIAEMAAGRANLERIGRGPAHVPETFSGKTG